MFIYRNQDGSVRRELRPASEVFNTDSLETLSMTALTMGHPSRPVTSENARGVQIGSVGQDVRRDGNRVRATITVNDANSIDTMQRGRRQISCGYWCDLEMTPGITEDGEAYDAIQKNIVYNHAAIVDRGRAGPDVAARLDAYGEGVDVAWMVLDDQTEDRQGLADIDDGDGKDLSDVKDCNGDSSAECRKDFTNTQDGTESMNRKITLDGVTYSFDADDTAFQAINKALTVNNTRADQLEVEKADMIDQHTAALDAEKARADAAEEKLADAIKRADEASDPAKIRKAIDDRLELERTGQKMLGEKFDRASSDDDIRRACIAIVSDVDLTEKSDAYVEARFEAAIEQFDRDAARQQKADESRANVRAAAEHADEGEDLIEAAKKRAAAKRADAWRQPLTASLDRPEETITVRG